ncbi:uncharacterized protein LACBIDRAFT_334523 [Laccaria bicolor S238N-H82]|uniref:Predicted protein n=1 Tax=Laccaria bicolor (strain S238N-H82 / ATCC MYA-4686) TaxID=486041 RepID=B0DZF2_LACBS|nr:uncharacterized protein LACBIDRAFT_334523 [Laccaria bicolor S238N-H82]EDR00005.1 predicted protein [Laccaria bicolor S238N-H82]|eukprot:XP_001889314.1 predicted protein [Laccaria bicolor S238N-H82]
MPKMQRTEGKKELAVGKGKEKAGGKTTDLEGPREKILAVRATAPKTVSRRGKAIFRALKAEVETMLVLLSHLASGSFVECQGLIVNKRWKTAEGAMAANTRVLPTVSLGHFEDLMTFVYGFWLLLFKCWRSIGGPVTRLWFLPHC